MTKRLKILRHGRCFDGVASAALFARFFQERIEPGCEVVHVGKSHARGPVFHDSDFDADVHAVVDFRYAADDRLDWWFDHHASAFQPRLDEEHFRARRGDTFFFDPDARSCTKLLAQSLVAVYGWDVGRYAELVHWADIIDGAQFDSAAQAIDLDQPALRLMTFAEHNDNPLLESLLLDGLTHGSLESLASQSFISSVVTPISYKQARASAAVRARITLEHHVAAFDLGDDGLDEYPKFVPYHIEPEAQYVVAVTANATQSKVHVGSNPWNRPQPLIHLARICERYGGGGHAVVGAITLGPGQLPEARRIAAEITQELRRAQPGKDR